MKKRVLFPCSGNSARSQMAEGLLRHLSKGEVESFSAGTDPVPVKPLAIQVIKEIGIDISRHCSNGLEGDEDTKHRAFRKARDELRQRIGLFLLANKLLSGDAARRAG